MQKLVNYKELYQKPKFNHLGYAKRGWELGRCVQDPEMLEDVFASCCSWIGASGHLANHWSMQRVRQPWQRSGGYKLSRNINSKIILLWFKSLTLTLRSANFNKKILLNFLVKIVKQKIHMSNLIHFQGEMFHFFPQKKKRWEAKVLKFFIENFNVL